MSDHTAARSDRDRDRPASAAERARAADRDQPARIIGIAASAADALREDPARAGVQRLDRAVGGHRDIARSAAAPGVGADRHQPRTRPGAAAAAANRFGQDTVRRDPLGEDVRTRVGHDRNVLAKAGRAARRAERHKPGGIATRPATAADRLHNQAIGIAALGDDAASAGELGRGGAAIATRTRIATKHDDPAARAAIAALAADRLDQHAVRRFALGQDRSAILAIGRTALTADAAIARNADDAITAAARPGIAAQALDEDSDGALARGDDGRAAVGRCRTALRGQPAIAAVGNAITLATDARGAGHALDQDAVAFEAAGRDRSDRDIGRRGAAVASSAAGLGTVTTERISGAARPAIAARADHDDTRKIRADRRDIAIGWLDFADRIGPDGAIAARRGRDPDFDAADERDAEPNAAARAAVAAATALLVIGELVHIARGGREGDRGRAAGAPANPGQRRIDRLDHAAGGRGGRPDHLVRHRGHDIIGVERNRGHFIISRNRRRDVGIDGGVFVPHLGREQDDIILVGANGIGADQLGHLFVQSGNRIEDIAADHAGADERCRGCGRSRGRKRHRAQRQRRRRQRSKQLERPAQLARAMGVDHAGGRHDQPLFEHSAEAKQRGFEQGRRRTEQRDHLVDFAKRRIGDA